MRVTIIPFDFVRLGHHLLLKVTGLLGLYSVYKGGSFTCYIFACFLVPCSSFGQPITPLSGTLRPPPAWADGLDVSIFGCKTSFPQAYHVLAPRYHN